MTSGYTNIDILDVFFDMHWANPLRFRMLYLVLGRLLRVDKRWQHVVILEGSDFPVRTVDELADYLAHYRDRSFIFLERASPRSYILVCAVYYSASCITHYSV